MKLVSVEGAYASLAELDVVIDKESETGIYSALDRDTDDKTPSRRSFFTPGGCEVSKPGQGIYIEKVLYTDGTSRSVNRYGM
ncbi:MAG: hypothetical protein Q4E63_03770 [Prevotellaceae bacterium]|nr:hypothetical protein [Prevotellaceae bacterium]